MLKYSFPCRIYCKGPEGQQLEFVQALGPVKKKFEDAMDARRRSVSNNQG
jgi:hypothetical protein